jgi:hypothetical protein
VRHGLARPKSPSRRTHLGRRHLDNAADDARREPGSVIGVSADGPEAEATFERRPIVSPGIR